MTKINEAIEMLQCAEYNCDNVKKLGAFFADAVKMQIRSAIDLLEEPESPQPSVFTAINSSEAPVPEPWNPDINRASTETYPADHRLSDIAKGDHNEK